MNIKQTRSELSASHINRTQFAKDSGVSRKTIQRLIADPTYNPTLLTIQRIEKQLKKEQAKRDKVSA